MVHAEWTRTPGYSQYDTTINVMVEDRPVGFTFDVNDPDSSFARIENLKPCRGVTSEDLCKLALTDCQTELDISVHDGVISVRSGQCTGLKGCCFCKKTRKMLSQKNRRHTTTPKMKTLHKNTPLTRMTKDRMKEAIQLQRKEIEDLKKKISKV